MLQPLTHSCLQKLSACRSLRHLTHKKAKSKRGALPSPSLLLIPPGLAAGKLGPQCPFPCILLAIRSYSFLLHFPLLPYCPSFCPGSGPYCPCSSQRMRCLFCFQAQPSGLLQETLSVLSFSPSLCFRSTNTIGAPFYGTLTPTLCCPQAIVLVLSCPSMINVL